MGGVFRWPANFIIGLLVVATVLFFLSREREAAIIKRRCRIGCCGHCGYDLRHKPLRCPECGQPSKYRVILYNDEAHTRTEAVEALVAARRCPPSTAADLIRAVHENGSATVARSNFWLSSRIHDRLSAQGFKVALLPVLSDG